MKRRRRAARGRVLVAAAIVLAFVWAISRVRAEQPAGERLYLHGITADGSSVAATVQGDLRVRSTDMPCAGCHRRSGWGTAEGSVVTPPLVGAVLFAPMTQGAAQLGMPRATGPGTRPAYTTASLLRALRDGIDPAGRTLSPTMPRYAVSEQDAAALAAHLRSLSAEPPPGVTPASVRLATIVTPEVDARRRASLVDTLTAYLRLKNGGSRHEARRRERGGWDMKQQYDTYREWVLDVWELHGPSSTWDAQLEARYRRQPVFAIVSGAGNDWSPIDAFSRRHRLPTVLPETALPPSPGGDDFYTFYFSRGVRLEADTLARELDAHPLGAPVLQVSRCGSAGATAAALVAAAIKQQAVTSECIPGEAAITSETWRPLLKGDKRALVLWLGATDLQTLPHDGATTLYLSSSLLGNEASGLPPQVARHARLLHPFVAPDQLEAHAFRSLAWLKSAGVPLVDRTMAVDALFAAMLVGEALSIPRTLESREYFVERIEHMTSRSASRSAYPRVAFDAKRRFGSTDCQILEAPVPLAVLTSEVQPWFVPTR